MGVFEKAVGEAADDEALLACRRWSRLDRFLGRRDVARVSWVADLAGARSWAQGNGSFAFGMLTHARP